MNAFKVFSRHPFLLLRIEKLYVKHERPCLTTIPNTEKRVDNTTRSGVFITNFEVLFENVLKHFLEYLIYLLNRN